MSPGNVHAELARDSFEPRSSDATIASVRSFFYIANRANLPSILERGILSNATARRDGLTPKTVYDPSIVSRRATIKSPAGRSLHEYANVYLQPRNAMLFRVLHEAADEREIVVLQIRPEVRQTPGAFVTTGNAAAGATEIRPAEAYDAVVEELRDDLLREYWRDEDGSKRRMMAELLVPDRIPPEYIESVLVGQETAVAPVQQLLGNRSMPVLVQAYQFFRPLNKMTLSPRLALVRGDLFFSAKQTLTVSVNCVGVMGKGLASRAKYQFPDLYVYYQDQCRAKKLRLGRPVLYKPETSLTLQLADEWHARRHDHVQFLLFATKQHWRERSDLGAIVEGLDWLVENYRKEGIKSLAIPALGCGLGRLPWREVGPAMCQRLDRMKVSTWVYVPAEKDTPKEELTREFLLGA